MFFINKKIAVLSVCTTVALSVTGCGRLAVSDGSLDYQKAKLLKPIQLPAGQSAREIYPLYQLPDKGAKNQVPLTNSKGNRYELPRPNAPLIVEEVSQPSASVTPDVKQPASEQAQPEQVQSATAANYAVALTQTEEGIPILQVEASPQQTREKVRAVLGEAGYVVVNDVLGRFTVKHVNFSGERLLQYRNLGSVTTLLVTTTDSKLAGGRESLRILSDLRANW